MNNSNLSHSEAIALSLKTKWKAVTCNSGEICWCRSISPEPEIKDKDGNGIYIVGAGAINKEHAEYIVNLHNATIENQNSYTIKKGAKYICIKDFVMHDDTIAYTKNTTYLSECDGCITDNVYDAFHEMTGLSDFFDHFRLLPN